MDSRYRSAAQLSKRQERRDRSQKDHTHEGRRGDKNACSAGAAPCGTTSSPSDHSTLSLSPEATISPIPFPRQPTIIYSQNAELDQPVKPSSSPTAIIVGAACGVCALLAGAVALWWCLRRRRRQQILSNSKTVLMSPRPSHHTYDLESQQQHSHIDHDSGVSEKGDCSPFSSQRSTRPPYPAAGVESSSYYTTRSAPIPARSFPSQTPQSQKLDSNRSSFTVDDRSQNERDAAQNHRFPRQKSLQTITLPIIPPAALITSPISPTLQYARITGHQDGLCEKEGEEDVDFYVDILDLVGGSAEDRSPRRKQSRVGNPSSESTPSSSPPQTPTRRRSLTDSPRTSNVGSPRSSKEARRFIQNFPPPPPPPSVPPPAIPEDASNVPSTRTGRSRALTAPSGGKGSQVYRWGSAPPSPTLKARRLGLSPSSSTKNLVILPPSSPPPVYISVQQAQGSKEPHNHQRTQSSVLASSSFVETLNQICEPLPLPSSVSSRGTNGTNGSYGTQITSLPIVLPSPSQCQKPSRPILRQHHSHHGSIKMNGAEKGSVPTSPKMESTPLTDLSVRIGQMIQAMNEAEGPGRRIVSSP
ncbi:hypothetical protein B0O80DRAFT_497361 [Mortierella sp. GBAus27b]|nr:hypothetical protein B0O80DRAFT_497361 [Mortierella sp. GBAus27b]